MSGTELENSSIPLYQQIANDLRGRIERGVYRAGAKIPTEPELSQLYAVSRITVRKAIENLVDAGLLIKRQGKGTFVCEPARKPIVREAWGSNDVVGFSASCRSNGLVPGARVLRCECVGVPEELQSFFGDDGSEGLIAIDRVRTADGQPVMVEYNLFPRRALEFLMEGDLNDTSLFEIIEGRTGRRAHRNKAQTLNIFLADEELSRVLSVPLGEPLFRLVGEFVDESGKPLYFGRQYIIGSRYTFSM